MCKGIDGLKMGCQARAYVIKKYDGTILKNTTSILSSCKQFYNNLLNYYLMEISIPLS